MKSRGKKKRRHQVSAGLARLHHRQRGLCAYCKRRMRLTLKPIDEQATRDHVIPRCDGGTRVVAACRECNNRKGSMAPGVFMDLLNGSRHASSEIRRSEESPDVPDQGPPPA